LCFGIPAYCAAGKDGRELEGLKYMYAKTERERERERESSVISDLFYERGKAVYPESNSPPHQ